MSHKKKRAIEKTQEDRFFEKIRDKLVRYAEDDAGDVAQPAPVATDEAYEKMVGSNDTRVLRRYYEGYRWWDQQVICDWMLAYGKQLDLTWAHQCRAIRRAETRAAELELKLDVLLDMKRMGEIDASHGVGVNRARRLSL